MKTLKLFVTVIVFLFWFTHPGASHAGEYRSIWKTAKRQAEAQFDATCKDAIRGESDRNRKREIKELCQFFRFKGDFGPNLDKFEKAADRYDDKKDAASLAEVEEFGAQVDQTAKTYMRYIGSKVKEWKRADLPFRDWARTLSRPLKKIRKEVKAKKKVKMESSRAEVSHWDVTQVLTRNLNARYTSLQLPATHEVSLHITGSNAAVMAENPVVHQLFYDAAWEQVKTHGEELKRELADIDGQLGSHAISERNAERAVKRAYGLFAKKLNRSGVRAINGEWNKYKKEHREYAGYKISAGFRVAGQVAGIVTSSVGIATTGWSGVGTVSSIIGLVKSVTEMSRNIWTLLQSADQLGTEIQQDFDDLETKFNDASEQGRSEIARGAFERLTGIAMNTVNRIEGKVDTYQSKLKGCKDRSVEKGRDLRRLLDEIDSHQERIKVISDAAAEDRDLQRALRGYGRTLEKLERALNAMLTQITDEMESYQKGKGQAKNIGKRLKRLQSIEPEWASNVRRFILPLLDFAYVGTAGGTGDVIQSAIVTTTQLAAELTSEAAEAGDAVKEAVEHGALAADNVSNLVDIFK